MYAEYEYHKHYEFKNEALMARLLPRTSRNDLRALQREADHYLPKLRLQLKTIHEKKEKEEEKREERAAPRRRAYQQELEKELKQARRLVAPPQNYDDDDDIKEDPERK